MSVFKVASAILRKTDWSARRSQGWGAEHLCAARALRVRGKVVFSHCSQAVMSGARRARMLLSCLACFQVHCEFLLELPTPL